jgi:hypothetical protein
MLGMIAGCGKMPVAENGGDEAIAKDGEVVHDKAAATPDVFETLTRTVWAHLPPQRHALLAESQTTIQFRRDGRYRWFCHSDYPEKNTSGPWSMVLADAHSGVLHLGEGGSVWFEIKGERLVLGGMTLDPGEPITYTEAEAAREASDLPDVPPSDDFQRLVSTPWKKTNRFEEYRIPDRVEFRANGRYSASYRSGACAHEGRWSLIDTTGRRLLTTTSEENACDQRGYSAGLVGVDPYWIGDLLVLETCYLPAAMTTDAQTFVFDGYSDSLRTLGAYRGQLMQGRLSAIELTHTNLKSSQRQLQSLTITFQRGKIVPRGGVSIGEPLVVVRHDFKGLPLASGESHVQQVRLTPPFAGMVWFTIELAYRDVTQTYNSRGSFAVEIAEP